MNVPLRIGFGRFGIGRSGRIYCRVPSCRLFQVCVAKNMLTCVLIVEKELCQLFDCSHLYANFFQPGKLKPSQSSKTYRISYEGFVAPADQLMPFHMFS